MPPTARPVEDRVWTQFAVSPLGCWEWTATITSQGYGVLDVAGKSVRAHRIAYELTWGPVPAGQVVCHRCCNRRCINPTHLYAGTVADNNRDTVVHGGRMHDYAAAVAAVERGMLPTAAARCFGINRHTLRRLLRGEHWSTTREG